MASRDFIKIERQKGDRTRVHLLHTQDPRFVMEVTPSKDPQGRVNGGVIKRICYQNSSVGDYQKYSRLTTEAQRFFDRTILNVEAEGVRRMSAPSHG